MTENYKFISKMLVSMYPLHDLDEAIKPRNDEKDEKVTIKDVTRQETQDNEESQTAEGAAETSKPTQPKPLLTKTLSLGYVDTDAAEMGAIPMRGDRRHDWKRIQMTTFTNWINDRLSSTRGANSIKNLSVDLEDGLALIQLVENLASKKMRGYNKAPEITAQKISNLDVMFTFLQEDGVKIIGIGKRL